MKWVILATMENRSEKIEKSAGCGLLVNLLKKRRRGAESSWQSPAKGNALRRAPGMLRFRGLGESKALVGGFSTVEKSRPQRPRPSAEKSPREVQS